MSKIDLPIVEAKRPLKEFVTIPETDLFDHKFPTIRVNNHEFFAGKTYELEFELASTVKERIQAWQRSDLRLVQPKRDLKSENVLAKSGSGGYVDPSTIG